MKERKEAKNKKDTYTISNNNNEKNDQQEEYCMWVSRRQTSFLWGVDGVVSIGFFLKQYFSLTCVHFITHWMMGK